MFNSLVSCLTFSKNINNTVYIKWLRDILKSLYFKGTFKILYLHSFGLLDVRIKDIIYDFWPKKCQKLLSSVYSLYFLCLQVTLQAKCTIYQSIYLYLLTVYNEFHTDPCTLPHKWSKQIIILTFFSSSMKFFSTSTSKIYFDL